MISRVELERMLNDIKNGIIKKVWAIEFTRLSRSVEDLQVLKRLFNQYKTDLYINGSLSDLSLADQRFLFNINAAVSEYERERIVERAKRGLAERKDLGITHSPQIYGYERKYDPSGNPYYEIIEEEASIIKTIYKKRRKGWSLSSIANYLNAKQIPTKLDRKWRRKGVSNVLNHIVYTGYTRNSLGEVIKSNLYPSIISMKEYKRL